MHDLGRQGRKTVAENKTRLPNPRKGRGACDARCWKYFFFFFHYPKSDTLRMRGWVSQAFTGKSVPAMTPTSWAKG